MKKSIMLIVLFIVLLPFQTASASWAYQFVVYSGDIYEVTGEPILSNEIDKRIGKVTRYSDHEGTYSGNFSNIFPKGTAYYSIKDNRTKDMIAVEKQADEYVKAIYKGAYGSGGMESKQVFWTYSMIGVIAIIVFFIAVVIIRKRR